MKTNFGATVYSTLILAMLNIAASQLSLHAALIAVDNFDYFPAGSDLTGSSGGDSFGFSGPWSGQTSYNIGDGSLASPRDPLPRIGNCVTAVAFGDNRSIDRELTTPLGDEGTSAYISFLVQPQGILHQGAYNGWFALALRGSTDIFAGMSSFGDSYSLEVGFERAITNTSAAVGKTAFLVLRIDFTEGVDPVRLYVNPQPGAPEPAAPSASLINLNVNFINTISLTGPGASAFDAIRIGTTFADVAPAAADYDNDGAVGAGDLAIWQTGFGMPEPATRSQGDADENADVDGADLMIWQRQTGFPHAANVQPLAVPEPAGLTLMALLLCCMACSRNNRVRRRPVPARFLRA